MILAMQQTIRTNTLILFIGDLIVFAGALVVALAARYQEVPSNQILNEHLPPFIALFVLWSVVFFIAGLYDHSVSLNRKRIPDLLLKIQLINILFSVVFFFVFPVGITPKTTLVLYLVCSFVLLSVWRLFIFPFMAAGAPLRALIVGTGNEVQELEHILNENPYFKFVAAEVINTNAYDTNKELEDALLFYVGKHDIQIIIGDTHDPKARHLLPLYYNLTFLNQDVRFVSLHQLYEHLFNRIPPSVIGEEWLLENISQQSRYIYDTLKRAIDIFGAVLLGVPSLILYPFIMVAIKLHDRGAVFYTSERIGQFNKPIHIIKFRSMSGHDSGDAALHSTLEVTKVGAFLRRTRLDEIPQLWNVLRGDLSFIGPRPEMPALAHMYAEHIPHYNMRHLIKPGLSGWAQINNFDVPRKGVDVPRTLDKLSFDLFYLKRRSLLLDIEILLKTIKTLVLRSGT